MPKTRRQQIADRLSHTPATVPELAESLGVPIGQVAADLEHLRRSFKSRLRIEPARCPRCGKVFRERTRFTRPSRCPDCRDERVSWPQIELSDRDAGGKT